ncbi:ABC transporter ATP-binding protein [Oscillatoria sp. FACHB-1406]|uniref:ABC transporter ATP-binding protein n=1 Tax=Oscillatoria sp. FACHB-1406 TaxID=2692846 RepID=UPI001685C91B|nr:ABC transporter ATP-binding protein [Oscillatoria sp. FACHB-1406]MBD2577040.1 ABC transporter ATP-binding protein [Oscillatoria sp. FACHB-1406]
MTDSYPAVILHLQEATRQYSSQAPPAVNAVTLTLHSGDILSFLGPSGCGKTTLLRLIAGFERPDGGTIEIASRKVAGLGHWLPPEKRGVGMVFQDYALFPHLNVSQNVTFGLSNSSGKLSAAAQQRAGEVLALVGLQGLEKRYPHQLSGGQQQRVALARALAPRPQLVLLDEPLSNLDAQVRLRLRQELREILKAAGTSAIFVTHDQEEALSISDWIAVMRQGQLEQFGSPETIYQEPATHFVAEFVAQSNSIPARREGKGWVTEIGYFQDNKNDNNDNIERGELMVRQEDLILQEDEAGEAVVRDRQFLGREHRYRLETPSGRELIARMDALKVLPVGARIKVSVAGGNYRVFPLESNNF